MFNLFLFISIFTLLFLSSISDIKKREISNKLLLFFLVLGVCFKFIFAIISKDFSIISFMLFCFILSLFFFFIFWEFGVIAGGDLKLFLVISILAPKIALPLGISSYFFPMLLFVISLFMLIPWLFVYSFYFIFKNKYYINIYKTLFSKSNLINMLDSFLFVFLLGLFFPFFSSIIYLFIVSFVFSLFVFKLKHKYLFFSFLYLVCIFLILNNIISFRLVFVFEVMFFVFLFSLLKHTYSLVKDKILVTTKPLSKLKEGDLLLYNYYYKNKKLTTIKPNFFTKIKMLLNNTYYKDLKIDSALASGISSKDIAFLKRLYKNNLVSNKVYLKKTLAFVPAVFLSFILFILI